MFRILATFALISAFLQIASLATAPTDEEQNSAQPANAVIEWNRTLLAIVRTPGAQPATHFRCHLRVAHGSDSTLHQLLRSGGGSGTESYLCGATLPN